MKNLTLLLGASLLATLLSTACSDDEDAGSGPQGVGADAGRGGTAGTAGTGGGGTGGRGGTTGTGGTNGRGGTAGSGGTTGGPTDGGPDGDGGPKDGGPDGNDGGCPPGEVLRYDTAGCDARPRCVSPFGDACISYACSCTGTTISGACGYYNEPFRHAGPCSDGSDGGPDASDGSIG